MQSGPTGSLNILLVRRAGVIGIVIITGPVDIPSLNTVEEDIRLRRVVEILTYISNLSPNYSTRYQV
jgi:ABC-type tungstate transport system substrate-binding protein